MVVSALDDLACPLCDGRLTVVDAPGARGGEVLYGTVRCRCAEYAIVDGILVLQQSGGTAEIVDLVKRGERDRVLALLLGEDAQRVLRRARWIAERRPWGPLLARLLVDRAHRRAAARHERFTRDGAVWQILGASPFETYLKHRFSAESFWPVFAAVPLLQRRNGAVLDVGCGMGHASFVLSALVRPHRLFSVDQTFWGLFLARRFMSPASVFVALDVNAALPFRDEFFDCVLGLDMFHYVESRAAFAREVQRIATPAALVAMLHVHNALQSNFAAGHALPPTDWVRLFRRIPVRAYAERRLVEEFMTGGRLDLGARHDAAEVDAANAIALIGSRDETLFRTYEGAEDVVLQSASRLRLNPLYRQVARDGSLVLERVFPTDRFREEYPLTEKHLPPRVVIDGAGTDVSRLATERPELARALVRQLVLLPLPERYL